MIDTGPRFMLLKHHLLQYPGTKAAQQHHRQPTHLRRHQKQTTHSSPKTPETGTRNQFVSQKQGQRTNTAQLQTTHHHSSSKTPGTRNHCGTTTDHHSSPKTPGTREPMCQKQGQGTDAAQLIHLRRHQKQGQKKAHKLNLKKNCFSLLYRTLACFGCFSACFSLLYRSSLFQLLYVFDCPNG